MQHVESRKTEKQKTHSTEIQLLGQRIVLRTSESDPELVDETVQLVSVLLRNAELRGKSKVPHQVVLLALLDLAEEYVKSKRRAAGHKRQMTEKSTQLLLLIENELKGQSCQS